MARSIRPEQRYPLRLLVPCYEGNISIKWLRRLEVSDAPLYAVTAYILSEAKIIAQDAVMDAKSLAAIKMPNSNGFIPDRRPEKFPTVAASPHQFMTIKYGSFGDRRSFIACRGTNSPNPAFRPGRIFLHGNNCIDLSETTATNLISVAVPVLGATGA
jgi:hypothetical protein